MEQTIKKIIKYFKHNYLVYETKRLKWWNKEMKKFNYELNRDWGKLIKNL